MATVVQGSYEWDATKARTNQRKHKVGFPEAATALAHPGVKCWEDDGGEGRLRAVGMSRRKRMLTVIFEERGERERIISARPTTRAELRQYLSEG